MAQLMRFDSKNLHINRRHASVSDGAADGTSEGKSTVKSGSGELLLLTFSSLLESIHLRGSHGENEMEWRSETRGDERRRGKDRCWVMKLGDGIVGKMLLMREKRKLFQSAGSFSSARSAAASRKLQLPSGTTLRLRNLQLGKF